MPRLLWGVVIVFAAAAGARAGEEGIHGPFAGDALGATFAVTGETVCDGAGSPVDARVGSVPCAGSESGGVLAYECECVAGETLSVTADCDGNLEFDEVLLSCGGRNE